MKLHRVIETPRALNHMRMGNSSQSDLHASHRMNKINQNTLEEEDFIITP